MKHGRLQSMGLKVRHNGATNRIFLYFYIKLVIHQVRKMLKTIQRKGKKNQQRQEQAILQEIQMSNCFFFSFFEINF